MSIDSMPGPGIENASSRAVAAIDASPMSDYLTSLIYKFGDFCEALTKKAISSGYTRVGNFLGRIGQACHNFGNKDGALFARGTPGARGNEIESNARGKGRGADENSLSSKSEKIEKGAPDRVVAPKYNRVEQMSAAAYNSYHVAEVNLGNFSPTYVGAPGPQQSRGRGI